MERREFLKTTAAGAAAMGFTAASYDRVFGANERVGIAFLGVGGRCQQHINTVNNLKKTDTNLATVAVCDVWDGNNKLSRGTGRGLYPSARKCGLNADDKKHVSKDYRRILELPEVDVVCIATPDHWHAKMTCDAADAGKHIYCEKPMTRTIEEAQEVVARVRKNKRVMTVGVQSMADPTWRKAYEMIRNGDIGHVAQAQTSYYRNSTVGQWRYYPLTPDMTPKSVDWEMFLGHKHSLFPGTPLGPEIPFDRAIFAQWRCYWPFGGGMFTDLFVHQTTHMIAAMGVRNPSRVVGGGGLYLEYDGRDVPDVATVVADYDEGCQLVITATMINSHPIEECIRGHLATLSFKRQSRKENGRNINEFGFEVIPQRISARPTGPNSTSNLKGEFVPGGLQGNDTEALWKDFIEHVRKEDPNTLSTPELGAAAFTTVNMGVISYREGKALFWDKERNRVIPADPSWAQKWEERSEKRGKPNQIIGWKGGD